MTTGVTQSGVTQYCWRLAAALAAGVVFTSPALAEDVSIDPLLRACRYRSGGSRGGGMASAGRLARCHWHGRKRP